jgi:hypothetical protein
LNPLIELQQLFYFNILANFQRPPLRTVTLKVKVTFFIKKNNYEEKISNHISEQFAHQASAQIHTHLIVSI